MILWLDDLRDPTQFGYPDAIWVKNYKEAINFLILVNFTFASLDHDLGEHEKSGYDLICWMEKNKIWPEYGVRAHSQNPVGRDRMNQVIEKHYGRLF